MSVASIERELFDVYGARDELRRRGATTVSVGFIRRLIQNGEIPRVRIGRKDYIKRATLDAWLSRRERRAS
jgi:excisionase family DNA binding protein